MRIVVRLTLLKDYQPPLKKQVRKEPPPETVAARIWGLRKQGEKDSDFARRLGLSPQALFEMAKGKGGVSSTVLAEVVRRTGADPVYLLLGKRSDVKSEDRMRLEEIAAILQRAGVIPPEDRLAGRMAIDALRVRGSAAAPQKGPADQTQSTPDRHHSRPAKRAQGGRGGRGSK